MDSTPTLFAKVAAPLAANGYRPVPIAPGQKYPDIPEWQKFAFTAGCAKKYPRHGAGVLCGDVAGLDIDVDDPDAVAAVENAVREALGLGEAAELPRRVGRYPRVLLPLRTSSPFKKMRSADFKLRSNGTLAHIEILGDGQQFVAFHVHPVTKRAYEWNGGGSILTIKRDELPEVDEDLARKLLRVGEAALEEWGDRVGEPDDKARGAGPGDAEGPRRYTDGGRNDALIREAGRLRRLGYSEAAIAALLHVLNHERCDPPLPEAEIEGIAKSAGKYAPGADARTANHDPGPPLGTIYTGTALLATEATPTRWLIDGWVSEGASVLIGAHGGSGKSWLALQAAACLATGKPFLGLPTQCRRTLLYAAEDRADVLRWRLRSICEALSIEPATLAETLTLIDQSRKPAELMGRDPDRYGAFGYAPVFEALAAALRERTIEVLVIDSASDAFGGNEIARAEVRRYINEVQRLVPDTGTVLHIVHVDKAYARGKTSGQGYSGSTAWHNSVRQRWELSNPAEKDKGSQQDDGLTDQADPTDPADPRRVLMLVKNNYGPAGAELALTFDADAGIFIVDASVAPGGIVESIRNRAERRGIVCAMIASATAGVPVPAAMQGSRTAYLVLSARPEFPDSLRGGAKARRVRFARHLEELRQIRHIVEDSIRRSNRHTLNILKVTPEGCAECATF